MRLQGDLGSYISGMPVFLQSSNIFVVPPTVKQILSFGEDNFFITTHIISSPEEVLSSVQQGNSGLGDYSDFQLLLVILKEEAKSKRLVNEYFDLVFPDYQIFITDSSIDFLQENRVVGRVTPFSFGELKTALSELFEPQSKSKEPEYNPANDAAQAIAEKLKKGREKIKSQKSKKEESESFSLFSTYASALSIGLGVDLNCLLNYTPFQLYDAFNRYSAKLEYDLYRTIALQPFADASNLDEPQPWYGNLY